MRAKTVAGGDGARRSFDRRRGRPRTRRPWARQSLETLAEEEVAFAAAKPAFETGEDLAEIAVWADVFERAHPRQTGKPEENAHAH